MYCSGFTLSRRTLNLNSYSLEEREKLIVVVGSNPTSLYNIELK